jgi:hypothetical protein
MWLWVLIVSAILTAFFLIVALAQMEAGIKAKPKWAVLTFCSFAVVVVLIILKPKPNMEPIQYMPAAPPVSENVDKPKNEVSKESASKSTGNAGGLSGGEKSQGVTEKNQEAQGQSKDAKEKAQGEQGAKGAAGTGQEPTSTQKKSDKDGKVEYRDPVLEEILEYKRQAEEKRKENASAEPLAQQFSDTGTLLDENQQNKNPDPGETAIQQKPDLFSESQNDENNKREDEPQIQKPQIVKARVLVSFLNVRDKGSLDGLIIKSLNAGDIVEVVNQPETDEWINIELPSGQKGWVMKKYLKMLS